MSEMRDELARPIQPSFRNVRDFLNGLERSGHGYPTDHDDTDCGTCEMVREFRALLPPSIQKDDRK